MRVGTFEWIVEDARVGNVIPVAWHMAILNNISVVYLYMFMQQVVVIPFVCYDGNARMMCLLSSSDMLYFIRTVIML